MSNPIVPKIKARPSRLVPTRAMAVKIAMCYALVGGLWILCSGWAVHNLVQDSDLEALLENLKGWFFVAVTSLLLGWSLDRYFREIRQSTQLQQESEQRWLFALDGAGDGVWDWDAQTNEVFFSDQWKAMLGYAPHEIGTAFAEWESRVHPDDLPQVRGEIRKHLDGHTATYRSEHRLRCKDGSFKWILARGKVMSRTAEGGPLRVIGTHTDTTERKRTLEALQESESRFSVLFGAMGEGVALHELICDASGRAVDYRIVDVNPAFERHTGLLAETVRGQSARRVYAADAAPYLEVFAKVAQSGEPVSFEAYFAPLAKYFSVSVFAPKPGWFATVFMDITERKLDLLALRQSEERFRRVVESAPEAIFIRVKDRFAYLNAASVNLFGAPSAEALVGQPVLERFHPDSRAGVAERIRKLDDHGEVTSMASQMFLRLDGSLVPVMISAVPFNYQGEPGALVFAQNMSGQKLLEAQLRQAQKLEAIGQLAGGVAHDFNNILAAIMMHLGLLKMNANLDEETRWAVKELEVAAQRAAALTRQLLMFGRRSVLASKPLNLNDVVGNLLKMLTRLIGEQIDLRFDGKAGLPAVNADVGMVEQVLMNLVVNARDAMPKGGLITIQTFVAHFTELQALENSDRRVGSFVCLVVSDTGCGMDAATLKRIFEPFYTTKDAGRGTGLGLATVHGIIAQHGGWIEVLSTPGHGSTFSVYLPALAAVPATVSPTTETELVRRGRETILVVEDELKVRQVICQSLRVLGYDVHEAGNGHEAMALWQNHHAQVALLLTDMVMPEGMTGLELAERLQAQKPGLKVIVSSGYSAEIVQAGVPTRSGLIYLPKPYQMELLARLVRECLDRPAEPSLN